MKTLKGILARKAELRSLLESEKDVNLEDVKKELRELSEEQKQIEERAQIAKSIEKGEIVATVVEKPEERQQEAIEDIASTKEYRSAYFKNLQGKVLNEAEERALTTASSSVGAVIPTQTLNQIIEKLKQESIVLPLVTVLHIPSNVSMPVEGTINDAEVKDEGVSATDKADTMGNLNLTAYKLIKTISITAEVQEMSIDAFESFIVAQLVKKIKALVDYLIIKGSGSSQPTGIITAIGSDKLQTSANTGFTYTDLMTLLGALGAGYAKNAVLMAKRKFIYGTIASILDDNKRPIFKMETDGKFEGKLLGYPVVANDDVPDDTIIFGDFAFYFFNFVKEPTVEVDKSVGFRSGDVCYRVMALGDGNVGLKEAFVVMTKKS